MPPHEPPQHHEPQTPHEPSKHHEPPKHHEPSRPPEKPHTKPLLFGIEPCDLMLLGLMFLLYRESGDEEFLIILAVLAFSILMPEKRLFI